MWTQPTRSAEGLDQVTTTPTARSDANSIAAHAALVKKARSGVIDVYFVGDSITRRWGALDYPTFLAHFKTSFFGWNAANFAWGGDRTQNILWRLQNGELAGVSPKVFVIQAGTNNLADFESPDLRVAAINAGLQAIVTVCRQHAPDALIVLTAVFPRRDKPELNSSIAQINARLARFADGRTVRYLDFNDRLVDAQGRLSETVSADGLHLSLAGYRVWADALTPLLAERLGPPKEQDSAPAPTGDPAAK